MGRPRATEDTQGTSVALTRVTTQDGLRSHWPRITHFPRVEHGRSGQVGVLVDASSKGWLVVSALRPMMAFGFPDGVGNGKGGRWEDAQT